ncbi:MAG: Lrp/AsnC family transcriptional regulator [Pseudomonadota bacterium]|nr:Lrp/AsnC family transcriptional regulator [Pseudomonadota bacterium]
MIDQTDRRILDELARDAGLTSALLGERVGLSPSAAHRRVRLLEQRGLIDGYRARLSKAARGNPSIVFVEVTLSGQSQQVLGEFEQAIQLCNEITEAHLMGGQADYLLKVEVREGDSYERIHRELLAGLPGVQRLVSLFSIRTVIEDSR